MQSMEETGIFVVKNTNFDVSTWRKNPKKIRCCYPLLEPASPRNQDLKDVAIKKLSSDGDGPEWESSRMDQGREPTRSSPCRQSSWWRRIRPISAPPPAPPPAPAPPPPPPPPPLVVDPICRGQLLSATPSTAQPQSSSKNNNGRNQKKPHHQKQRSRGGGRSSRLNHQGWLNRRISLDIVKVKTKQIQSDNESWTWNKKT
jgi:hypothetical protein